MLRDRLLSSFILISIVVLLLWLDATWPLFQLGGLWLMPLLMFLSWGTATDCLRMLQASGKAVNAKLAILVTLMISLSPIVSSLIGQPTNAGAPTVLLAVALGLLIVLGHEVLRYEPGKMALERTGWTVFVSTLVGIPMAMLVMMRLLEVAPATSASVSNWGLAALIATVATTKSSDAGAYFAGKSLGKRKLIPRLSPGKTWEGLVGGAAVAVFVSYICANWIIPTLTTTNSAPKWWGPGLFGIGCAVFGLLGDLAESMAKRESGVKDSGQTLPGLGGVWDVTDSLMGAVMPAYAMLSLGWMGT